MDHNYRLRLLRRIPPIASVILLVAIGLVAHASLVQLDESTRWQRLAYQTTEAAQALLGSLTDTQRGMRGYILSERPDALDLYRQAVNDIPGQLTTLKHLLEENALDRAVAGKVDSAVEAVLIYSRQLLEARDQSGLQGAARMEMSGAGMAAMNRARAALQDISALARVELENHIRAADQDLGRTRTVIGLGACVALGLVLFANLVAGRQAQWTRDATTRLQLSEQRFRYMVDGVKDYALLMLDSNGTVLSWNTGAQRMYGYSSEEIVGRNFSCFYPDSSREARHPEQELRITAQENRYEEEGIRIRKDGSRFLANAVISAVRNEDGSLQGFAKVTRDITESRRREQANREQAQILDLANDTIFVRDTEDRITYWNQGAQRVYGWTRQEAVGQVTHTLLRTRFSQPLEQILQAVANAGHWEGELEHTRKDGTVITVASRWTLRRDEAGVVTGIIEMNYDITDRKQLALALQSKNDELMKASLAKDTFLANMSHELRTPLNGIIGFSEILTDELPGPVNAKQREYLGDILASGRHLLQLINDLLDLSKVGAGKMEFYPEFFAIDEAIEEACNVVRPNADSKRLALVTNRCQRVDQVYLDRQRFKQILLNLLSNAVKFTKDGGTVEVTTARASAGRFCVGVRDTGIGIAQEDMQRIFNEFEQLDTGAGRLYQGTGLGLALTRKLVTLQNGTIDVVSELGRGTTFTVTLPVMAEDEDGAPDPDQPVAALRRGTAMGSATPG